MKASAILLIAALAAPATVNAQGSGANFTNFVRQVQLPQPGTIRDVTGVSATGEIPSPLAIDPDGARFELWTIKNTTPVQEFLLAEQYVGTFVPQATLVITSEDPYTVIPRTRADRPFGVNFTVSGLLPGAGAPDAAKSVNLLHHVQTYGTGNGVGIDRSLATLIGTKSVNQNSLVGTPFTEPVTEIKVPGANRAKLRGEERYTVMSLKDFQVEAQVLASQFVQVWPVADGSIAGITPNQMIRFALPNVTLTINDVYPDSHTYAQVYKGTVRDGVEGVIVPGSSKVINDTVPQDLTLALSGYDSAFDEGGDGQWTMELLTVTPFGIDRLAHVTFNLDRTIEMNTSVHTLE